MSYNYHNNQPRNYPGANTPQQNQQHYQGQYQSQNPQPQHQPQQQRQGFNDPFFNFDNGLNMDIREDFDDPFEHMGNRMEGFGFPSVNQMLGQFQNEMNNMRQLTSGMENQFQNEMNNNNNLNNNQIQNPGQGVGQRGMFISMHGMGGGPGTMISKTYMSKMDYSGGQPREESYQSQSIKQIGEDGHNISERQEAYKNSMTGMQKAAHQRLFDDRGMKLIKERNVNTGEQSQHNILKGLQENEVDTFNQQYNDYREKVHFQDNYKYLNELNPGKMFKQLGKGKDGQQGNNLMLGDGNNYGNNNQYQPPQQHPYQPQGQNNQYQYGRPQQPPRQQYTPQYNNQNNNYGKGY